MTLSAALLAITMFLHVPHDCVKPHIMYSSNQVSKVCQLYTNAGNRALSCYVHAANTIILPNYCERTGCKRLMLHEVGRAVYDKCLGVDTLKDEQLEELEAL